MADEIRFSYPTGSTLYARIFDPDGDVWNGTAFEDWANANVADYDVALTDGSSGLYLADWPTDIDPGFQPGYILIVYLQAAGAPAITDIPVSDATTFEWDGTSMLYYTVEKGLLNIYDER